MNICLYLKNNEIRELVYDKERKRWMKYDNGANIRRKKQILEHFFQLKKGIQSVKLRNRFIQRQIWMLNTSIFLTTGLEMKNTEMY